MIPLCSLFLIGTSHLCLGREKTQEAKETYKAREAERIGRFLRPLPKFMLATHSCWVRKDPLMELTVVEKGAPGLFPEAL